MPVDLTLPLAAAAALILALAALAPFIQRSR